MRVSVPPTNVSPPMCHAMADNRASPLAPKVTHFDRVGSVWLGDAATSVAALLHGEVIGWTGHPMTMPLLIRDPSVTVEVRNTAGAIGIMRFNQLHPPFNNPAIRRALLGAVDQSDAYRRRRYRPRQVAR